MTTLTALRARSIIVPVALVAGLGAAVELRLMIGGVAVGSSVPAGLTFAAALAALTLAVRKASPPVSAAPDAAFPLLGVILAGALGAAVLCAPVAARMGGIHHRPAGNYVAWSLVVAIVAISEEAFLRGALYSQIEQASSGVAAVCMTGVCFAGLHIPIYGWRAGALDLAVGLWLGALRYVTRTWHAPALAHVVADLAGWWLR